MNSPDGILLIHQFLERSADLFPAKTALVYGRIRMTYAQINKAANRLSRRLLAAGLCPGDRVGLIWENSADYVIAYYGVLKAGAVIVSLSTELKPDALMSILADLEPAALIVSERKASLLLSCDLAKTTVRMCCMPRASVAPDPERCSLTWEHMVDGDAETESVNPDTPVDDTALAAIIYTSGSTGAPKGVMLSHRNIVANTRSICEYLALTKNDVQMVVLPFFYVMGKSLLNTHFAVGGTVVVNNNFAFPAAVIEEMVREKVTGFSGVPSTYAYLLHRSPFKSMRGQLSSLRYCSQAGGHMARQVKLSLREALPPHTDLIVMYGATEASARLSWLPPGRFLDKVDSIGVPIPGVKITILDERGAEVKQGETGEVVAQGDNIMLGYWKDPQTTARVLDKRGYHTGDLGYRDDEGFIFLAGRRDNQLKTGGHRIDPQEIEDRLMETGLVIETAVIGLPDPILDCKLVAVAVPVNDRTTEADILSRCAAMLPKYKTPSRIIFVKALPKKESGKTDRFVCRTIAERFVTVNVPVFK